LDELGGLCNLKLTYRETPTREIEILRAVTSDTRVLLPETLEGSPVTALGDHAFAPNALPVGGIETELTGGKTDAPFDNTKIREIFLPSRLERIGSYAFYNCSGLQKVHLSDSIEQWGGNIFMNCRQLHFFTINMKRMQGTTLYNIAIELRQEFVAELQYSDGTVSRLLFPEYDEYHEENSPAHQFDYVIEGCGYTYRHCFKNHEFSPASYDGMWTDFLKSARDTETALKLAWYRYSTPVELSAGAKKNYFDYLCGHSRDLLSWLLENEDNSGLSFFLKNTAPERSVLEEMSERARRNHQTEAQAILLEHMQRQFPARSRTFDL